LTTAALEVESLDTVLKGPRPSDAEIERVYAKTVIRAHWFNRKVGLPREEAESAAGLSVAQTLADMRTKSIGCNLETGSSRRVFWLLQEEARSRRRAWGGVMYPARIPAENWNEGDGEN
jgi:hypothetical protein